MELNDLIFLGACSLMSSRDISSNFRDEQAVKRAKEIWREVLLQDRADHEP